VTPCLTLQLLLLQLVQNCCHCVNYLLVLAELLPCQRPAAVSDPLTTLLLMTLPLPLLPLQ
jgi:hypothetical protein